jgi:hypothetical protein
VEYLGLNIHALFFDYFHNPKEKWKIKELMCVSYFSKITKTSPKE